MTMLLDQRRDSILAIVEERGYVSLQQLVDAVGASESTVRRDLEYLDRVGQVRRTRGGAASLSELGGDDTERATVHLEAKRSVARAARKLIESRETILLDGGSTTYELARLLGDEQLQVVTNSLPIANLLVGQPSIEVVFLGGHVYAKAGVALGPLTTAALQGLHTRRLIMGVGGITPAGLFNGNSLLVETERAMLAAADEVIVVADGSKFGHAELVSLCPLERIDRLVTDRPPGKEWKERLEAANVELIVAEPS